MAEIAQRCAFALVVIGTAGLLINELGPGWGRPATLTFAFLNLAGLAAIVTVRWRAAAGTQLRDD